MAPRLSPCPSCQAPTDEAQRYCLSCGAPCSDESARLLALAAGHPDPTSGAELAYTADGAPLVGPEGTPEAEAPAAAPAPIGRDRRALTSIALALAGVAILVVTGWSTDTAQTLASALPPGLSVTYPGGAAPAAVAAVSAAADDTTVDATVDDTVVADTGVVDTGVVDTGVTDTGVADTAATPTTTDTTTDTTPTSTTEDPVPPPINHAYVIVLADQDVAAAAQQPDTTPYLAKTLAPKGTVLSGYRAIAKGSLPNSVALVSGQGPTPQTAAGCPTYTDISPGDIGKNGQELGTGCVASVQSGTIGDQLAANGSTWHAYVEGPDGAGCRRPAAGEKDPHQAPQPGDAAVTWRNPFAYFHTAMDNPDCAKLITGLDALDKDLAAGSKAPAVSYIVPDRCHDGSADPCAEGAPAGAAAADAWLSTVVPRILASKAYKDGGLLAITSDRTEVNGADDPACCRPKTYPNLKDAGEGGRVGALLVSPYVAKGKLVETSFSHFTLLRTLEDIFKLPALGYAGLKTAGSLFPDVVESTKAG